MNFLCPYCGGELPPPSRKRSCPHCRRTILARSRPSHPKTWVKEEDLPKIEREWADEMLKEEMEISKKTGKQFLHSNRQSIRAWVQTGVVKNMKLYTADDESVCPNCRPLHGKIFPIHTPEEINAVMECGWIKNCQNSHCRCYLRPEDISMI